MKARTLAAYNALLAGCPDAVTGGARTFTELMQRLATRSGAIAAADLGCGVGVGILSLAARAQASGVNLRALGVDKGFKESNDGPFPDHDLALREILDRYRESIGTTQLERPPEFVRANLDGERWPLAPASLNLVVSNKLVMFLRDKLRFLEQVWGLLAPGGVGVIEFDVGVPGAPPTETPRVASPIPVPALLAAQSGFDIFSGASSLLAQSIEAGARGPLSLHKFVVSMRRNRPDALRFPLVWQQSDPFDGAPAGEDWGCVSRYC